MLGYAIVLPSVNKGTYEVLWMIPVPIALGQGNYIYM